MATLVRCSLRSVLPRFATVCRVDKNVFRSTHHIRTFCRATPLLSDRLFSDKHEWVSVDGDVGTIGISNYAQDKLGDIVYVQLPDMDQEIDQEDECGTLESVKAASELYSPLSGTVVELNNAVEETPSLINKSCYDKGYLFKMKLKDPAELEGLMSEEQYDEFLKAEE